MVDGDEILEVMPLDGLETTREYRAEADAALYRMPETASRLVMRPGLAAIVFPDDAHAPMQAPDGTPASPAGWCSRCGWPTSPDSA